MTFEEIIQRTRELRLARDQADSKLLIWLVEVERDYLKIILDSGCESFAQFAQEWRDARVYEAFKRGLEKVGSETALKIGSEATIVAGRLTNGPEKYAEACSAWCGEHGGVKPSRQTAERILQQTDPREVTPGPVRRLDELMKLRAENAQLQADKRSLEARVRQLEAKLAKLTKRAPVAPSARA